MRSIIHIIIHSIIEYFNCRVQFKLNVIAKGPPQQKGKAWQKKGRAWQFRDKKKFFEKEIEDHATGKKQTIR